MHAAASGSARTFLKLVDQGASVTVKNEKGMTAMHFAALSKADSSAVIRELHKRGVSPSIEIKSGRSSTAPYEEIPGFQPLHYVANVPACRLLIELGADPEGFGGDGGNVGTCAFMACADDRADILAAMIESGAPVTASYLWWAAKLGKAKTTKMLLEKGVDLSYVRDGKSILQAAVDRMHKGASHAACVKMLREAGAPEQV